MIQEVQNLEEQEAVGEKKLEAGWKMQDGKFDAEEHIDAKGDIEAEQTDKIEDGMENASVVFPESSTEPETAPTSEAKDGFTQTAKDCDNVDAHTLETIDTLTEIYIFADMYQISDFKVGLLAKLKSHINGYTNPISVFRVISRLRPYIPESDALLAEFMQEELPVAATQIVHRGDKGQKIFEDYVGLYGMIDVESAWDDGCGSPNGTKLRYSEVFMPFWYWTALREMRLEKLGIIDY